MVIFYSGLKFSTARFALQKKERNIAIMFPRGCSKGISLVKNFYNYTSKKSLLGNCLPHLQSRLTQTKRFQHEKVADITEEEVSESKSVIQKVNDEIMRRSYGRLFAVVQVCGKQFKITDEDLIVVENHWAPTAGDKIRLEKVLLVGCADFTLVGRPLLPRDQVAVYATIVEKTHSPTILHFYFKRRKRFKKTMLTKMFQTFIRINSIHINVAVDEIGNVDGARDRIF